MKNLKYLYASAICFALFCGLPVCGQGTAATTFSTLVKLGEPAPPFKASYWLRGKRIKQFEKGQIYVLEFYATWCTYCIKAMPHLSELNTQYAGKVRFIGVDVQEAAPWGKDPVAYSKPTVARFVSEGPGKAMNYDICRDTKDGYMTKNWVTAQGLYGQKGAGIPFTVIIKDGDVVWVGHPYLDGEMEKALGEVTDNTYDVSKFIQSCRDKLDSIAAAGKAAEARRTAATKVPALDAMNRAYDAQDYAAALKEAYAAIAQTPTLYRTTYVTRINAFKGLLPGKGDEALALVQLERKYTTDNHDSTERFLKDLAAIFGRQAGLDKSCYDFAVQTLRAVPTERVIQVRLQEGLAYAYYYQGNQAMAAQVMQQIIDRIKANGQNPAEYERVLAGLTVKRKAGPF